MLTFLYIFFNPETALCADRLHMHCVHMQAPPEDVEHTKTAYFVAQSDDAMEYAAIGMIYHFRDF